MDHYLRIGYGDQAGHLREGLTRLHDLLADTMTTAARGAAEPHR
jgi:hypothetical protein